MPRSADQFWCLSQRLKIKALNWMLARMAPRKYGNR
jgi:hypothetical protein